MWYNINIWIGGKNVKMGIDWYDDKQYNSTEQNRTEQNRTEQNRTEQANFMPFLSEYCYKQLY